MLTAMRYGAFIWPNNPRTYEVRCTRRAVEQKIPTGSHVMQDLGPAGRVMRGEGEFFGPEAYDTFRALAREFEKGGPGLLVHPIWQSAKVYFTALTLTQEPRENHVSYAFEFREAGEEDGGTTGLRQLSSGAATAGSSASSSSSTATAARYHTVVRGDTLWGIGQKYGRTIAELVSLNPWISNPNLIYAGQEVRVQ